MPSGGIVQVRKETVLEIELLVRQAREPDGVNEEPSYHEDGLVVRCGRVAKYSQIPGFVDKAKLQNGGPE